MKSVALLVLAVLSVFANATDHERGLSHHEAAPAETPPADHDDAGTSGHAHTGPATYLEAMIDFDPATNTDHVTAVKTGIAAAIAGHDAGVNVTVTHIATVYSVVPVVEEADAAAPAADAGHRRLTGTAYDIAVQVTVPEGSASNDLTTTVSALTAAEINTAVTAAIAADATLTEHTHFEVTAVHAHAPERGSNGGGHRRLSHHESSHDEDDISGELDCTGSDGGAEVGIDDPCCGGDRRLQHDDPGCGDVIDEGDGSDEDDWMMLLPHVCVDASVVECMGNNSDAWATTHVCLMDGLEALFQDMLPLCTCEQACPNFLDGFAVVGRALEEEDDATKWDLLCPVDATLRCIAGESSCGAPPDEITVVIGLLDGCSSDWTPRPLAVAVSMELSVPDPAAFVADPNSKTAVEEGIAAAAGVSTSKVEATLSVARRLSESDRRLTGTVSVDATIEAENAGAVEALHENVGLISTDTMADALNTALESAGIEVEVGVASLSAAVAAPPTHGTAATTTTTTSETQAAELEAAFAFGQTFGGGLLVAFATQLLV